MIQGIASFISLSQSTDIMSEGVSALVSGMGIVFLVLILISAVLGLFQYIEKPKKKSNTTNDVPANITIKEEDKQDDLELVAVISAAIAASLNTTTDKLQVRSFRRVRSARDKW